MADQYVHPDGKATSKIVAVGNRFDEVYRVECPCGWKSIPLGTSGAGREKLRHHRVHVAKGQDG